MIDTVRVSQKAKDQLMTLKRRTGVIQWNVLCRWALCRSLAEESAPSAADIQLDSNVEMDWKTFAGPDGDLYLALVQQRVVNDGFDDDPRTVQEQFKLHLHRGIGYLAGDKSLAGIVELAELATE
jgi:DNA sulfur modification protein DndE